MTNVSGLAGQPLTLECDANGFPVPEVVWLKDGHLVGISGEVGIRGVLCVLRWHREVAEGCDMSLGMPGFRGRGGTGLWSPQLHWPLFPPC